MAFPAFFDTCALYGGALNDLLLTLAERGMYRPLWSKDVLAELRRNLIERGIAADSVDRRIETMNGAFPDAEVHGYAELVDGMLCDDGDRHVLAAAVRANAEVLVTFNMRHFPDAALAPYEIELRHPDDFLLDQVGLHERRALGAVEHLLETYEAPPLTVADYCALLVRSGVPRFAERVQRSL